MNACGGQVRDRFGQERNGLFGPPLRQRRAAPQARGAGKHGGRADLRCQRACLARGLDSQLNVARGHRRPAEQEERLELPGAIPALTADRQRPLHGKDGVSGIAACHKQTTQGGLRFNACPPIARSLQEAPGFLQVLERLIIGASRPVRHSQADERAAVQRIQVVPLSDGDCRLQAAPGLPDIPNLRCGRGDAHQRPRDQIRVSGRLAEQGDRTFERGKSGCGVTATEPEQACGEFPTGLKSRSERRSDRGDILEH